MSAPRIYVADLAAYNAGDLSGVWVDLEEWPTAEGIERAVSDMLKESNFPNVMRWDWTCGGCGEQWRRDHRVGPGVATTEVMHCPTCASVNVAAGKPFSSAEEWAIHDHEGFGEWSPGEGERFVDVATMAEQIEAHGLAFPAWVEHIGAAVDDVDGFEEAYAGEWDSEKAYGEELATETIEGLSDEGSTLAMYFDYEAFTRDLFLGDYFSVDRGGGAGCWVFRST